MRFRNWNKYGSSKRDGFNYLWCVYSIRQQGKPTAATSAKDLRPYLKYVVQDTQSHYQSFKRNDDRLGWEQLRDMIKRLQRKLPPMPYRGKPLQLCSTWLPCLRLYNGGSLQYNTEQTFEGVSPSNAIFFILDPDGDGVQGRISFYLYTDGRITSGEKANSLPQTIVKLGTMTSQTRDPEYLKDWLK